MQKGNAQGGKDGDGTGTGGSGSSEGSAAPDVNDAAKAADLALKRLQQDLDRGEVDNELLEELGWTEEQLKMFSERMHDQLRSLKDTPDEANAPERLQRRRVEELLKSLDLESSAKDRLGRTDRDRAQQDTTSRKTQPPGRYRDLLKMYQKSLSRGKKR